METAIVVALIALGGSILASAGSIAAAIVAYRNMVKQLATQREVTARTLEHQAELERLKDARALRDAKPTRMRDDYKAILLFAWMMHDMLRHEEERRMLADDQRARWACWEKKVNEQWQEAMLAGHRALMGLSVETSTGQLLARFDEVQTLFNSHFGLDAWAEPRPSEQLASDRLRARVLSFEMDEIARQDLARLEEPL